MSKTRFVIAFILSSILAATALCAAQQPIAHGAKIYIGPMNGYETYLAAAFEKKKVPLTIVANESAADYVISGNSEHQKPGWAKIVFTGQIHSDEQASVSVINTHTKEVVFAYAVNKKNTLHGEQTSAEACAKHLKEQIERASK